MLCVRGIERSIVTHFSSLGLAEPLLRALTAEGYKAATPIQADVIPAALQGRDIVGIAQTGTGKTAAFTLPILNDLAERPSLSAPKSCRALILAPTRELAQQIVDSIRTYGRHLRPNVALVIGGANPRPQARLLAAGVDICVATPGRLLDHISAGVFSLGRTGMVVLDEADQMMDLGFMPAIRRVMSMLPQQRQTILLSATMPKQIRALAKDFLQDPAEFSIAPQSTPIERIDQQVVHTNTAGKKAKILEILSSQDVARAIVFTRTKHGADKVVKHLRQYGLKASAIHGNKSQGQRVRALDAFRAGEEPILVATDIAARGIDIDGVTHVVNYELPHVPETYVHRIGRTARAGNSGTAISLCLEEEKKLLRDIEKTIRMRIAAVGFTAPQSLEGRVTPPVAQATSAPRDEEKPQSPPRRRRRKPQANAKGGPQNRGAHREGQKREGQKGEQANAAPRGPRPPQKRRRRRAPAPANA